VHVFESRDRAFADDQVLQENVIFSARKDRASSTRVLVSSSTDVDSQDAESRLVAHDDLVHPDDSHVFIHIVPNGDGESVRLQMADLEASLPDLGLTVSTGRVVDFRAKELLRADPERNTVPLIYPCHLRSGYVEWPRLGGKKPNALNPGPRAGELLVPAGFYVLVKRFSAKEEPRRVVAAIYDPARVEANRVAFENHLNYYHLNGTGLPATAANGLVAFLNSTLVDSYFRQFSGHTQVNATDLRSLRYPAWDQLVTFGRGIGQKFPAREDLDRLFEEVIFRG
jgi:adenine-specific DNA-methyltransferase